MPIADPSSLIPFPRPRPLAAGTRWHTAATVAALFTALAGCGGGKDDSTAETADTTQATTETTRSISSVTAAEVTPAPTSARDAVRLANQATFGPTEALVASIKSQGANAWVSSQLALPISSRYSFGLGNQIHLQTTDTDFCTGRGENCWRDYYSTEPLVWDFYRNAITQPDQLRQRVSFALQQILVINNLEVSGTYGFRHYYNNIARFAFGNYRDLLKTVSLSPVMGDFLNNANNDKAAPNENYARELLQLFSLGTCELNSNGTLKGGQCTPTYTNDIVRAYAYAMTGWTYPKGGSTSYGCYPTGANCRFYDGDMVPVDRYHDEAERKLLSNVTVAAGTKAPAALESVLDSLMSHPNIAPFIGKQLIQHLVTSNPSDAYVQRVASAFIAGRYGNVGTGKRGDMSATVAAILLDSEARGDSVGRNAGKLREPVLLFTGVLRALNGRTDGDALSWWWGDQLRQHVFRAPSVFNFYPPNYPVAGTDLVGPAFGIHAASTALQRLNFLTYVIDWGGSNPSPDVPFPLGTKVSFNAFLADAPDAAKLVDRLSMLALGQTLQGAPRTSVIDAVSWWTASTDKDHWQEQRVKAAAYLIFASPQYQVQR